MASERRPDVLRDETPAEVYDQFYSSVGDDAGVYGVYDRPYRDSHYFPLNKAIFEEVVRLGGQTILEVSCGSGSFAHLLFDKSELDYHGFDNSQPIYSSCEITASAFPPLGYRKGVIGDVRRISRAQAALDRAANSVPDSSLGAGSTASECREVFFARSPRARSLLTRASKDLFKGRFYSTRT